MKSVCLRRPRSLSNRPKGTFAEVFKLWLLFQRNYAVIPQGTNIPVGGRLVVGRSADSSSNGGVTVDIAFAEGFTLNNNIKVLTTTTEGAEDIFSENVVLGTSGSGIEMGLEAARLEHLALPSRQGPP